MKYSERLRILLTCTAKHNVQNSGMAAAYAKGVIEGAVTCLMAQGATWERAWSIVQESLPQTVSVHAIPKDWPLG